MDPSYVEKTRGIYSILGRALPRYTISRIFIQDYVKLCLVILWIAMVSIYITSPWVSYSGRIVVLESVSTYTIIGVAVSAKSFTLTVRGINIIRLLIDLETYRYSSSLAIFIPILFIAILITIIFNINWCSAILSFVAMIFVIDFYRNSESLLHFFISRITPLVVEINSIDLGVGSLATLLISASIGILSTLSMLWREEKR